MNKPCYYKILKTIISLITLFLISISQLNGQNEFFFNGAADVIFRYPLRGSGGRAIVHDEGNVLTLNYGGDFTGGTRIGTTVYFSHNGNSFINGGNLGIGTFNITEKLTVFGGITTKYPSEDYPAVRGIFNHLGNAGGLNITSQGANSTTFGAGDIRFNTSISNSIDASSSAPIENRMIIRYNGNIGIGTENPFAKLSISDSKKGIEITPYWSNGNGVVFEAIDRNEYSKRVDMNFYIGNNESNIKFYTGAEEKMRINAQGNVLIGKTTQTSSETKFKLDVAGPIRANEIVVNTTGADFVFDPTYKLRTLPELETFIKEHKHLPEIAPAKEMQEKGVSAGEMQAKLLQKVEELTLYVIEQDKQLAEQQKLLIEFKSEIDDLKKELINKR